MTWIEVAAVIGALAWTPQIITWLHRAFTKPMVSFVTDRFAEIGFTTLGPILNVTLGIVSHRKGIVLQNMKIRIQHESGDHHVFRWQGMINRLGTMTAQGTRLPFEKDQSAIAIRIPAGDLEERFIRFRDGDFVDRNDALVAKAVDRSNAIQKVKADYHDDLLVSDEIAKHLEGIRHSIFWKPGTYECQITAESPAGFKVTQDRFSFTLTVPDVERLQKNVELLERDIENAIKAGLEGYEPHMTPWSWANPILRPGKAVEGGPSTPGEK